MTGLATRNAGQPAERLMAQAAAWRRTGDLGRAESLYRRALAGDSGNAELHYLAGVMAYDGGVPDRAGDSLTRAVLLDPASGASLRGLGAALSAGSRKSEARSWCRRALAIAKDDSLAFLALALLAKAEDRPDEAGRSYRAILALEPDHTAALASLANLLQGKGRFAEAEWLYRADLHLRPDHADSHRNYAVALCLQGRLEEAEREIRRAIRLQPDDPGSRMALGQILLLAGRLQEGWNFYEWRSAGQKDGVRTRRFTQPLWDGAPDRIVLIHAEQGFGDILQFCRYIPEAGLRAKIILDVPKVLAPLLAGLSGIHQLVITGDPLPEFDCHCPVMSLPRVFRTALETIPAPIPYLHADPERISLWRERLAGLDGLRVGLAWTGSPGTPRNRQRSIEPAKLSALAGIPGVHFVSLQKHQGTEAPVPPPEELGLYDGTDQIEDFADTAALIEALDLVISVDTSVVHLAGALAKPVWLMNRFSPCWRWLLGRDDSPWYPMLKQYRQPVFNDWDSVLARVTADLATLAGAGTASKGSEG